MSDQIPDSSPGEDAAATAPGDSPVGLADHPRIKLRREIADGDRRRRMAADVREGLGSDPKTLPPKYFYDTRGSKLFEAITRLPEYYPTRAERAILEDRAEDLVADLRPEALVEYGSGSSGKTRILLEAMDRAGLLRGYGPIDVSAEPVREAAGALAERYPELRIEGLVADFERPLELPFATMPRLVLFLGGTIGNLSREDAVAFLRRTADELSAADGLLVGFDLVKDRETLEAAYDDPARVTAEFNLNVLRVLNRELDAGFDLEAFRHLALWNEEESRIEMHLVSRRRQRVPIRALAMEVEFEREETILTEISRKYTRDRAGDLLEASGLSLERWETDRDDLFALAVAGP